MLHLRVFGSSSAMGDVAQHLAALPGARHVVIVGSGHDGNALVTADVRAQDADRALETVRGLGVAADDVSLLRSTRSTPAPPPRNPSHSSGPTCSDRLASTPARPCAISYSCRSPV
jgi:hypothetical protein